MQQSKYKFFVPSTNNQLNDFSENFDGLDLDLLNTEKKGGGLSAQPYIVEIRNTTGAAIFGVKVLGANANLRSNLPGTPNNYGNPLGIEINMGIGSVTYPEFLMQTQTEPFTVGLTYMYSTEPNQVLQTYAIQYKNANGNLASKFSIPVLDPYQSKENIIPVNDIYTMDGEGMIIVNKILADTTLKLYLYPTNIVIPRRALAGLPVEQNFGNPNVVNQQTMRLSKQATEYLLAK